MAEATFTFSVDESLKQEFTAAAQSSKCDGEELLRDYMREFVSQQQEVAASHDEWFQRQVRAGLDAANAGDVLSSEEVEAQAAEWRARLSRNLINGRP